MSNENNIDYSKAQATHELYIRASSWISDLSAPLKPRKKFNRYGAAGAGNKPYIINSSSNNKKN